MALSGTALRAFVGLAAALVLGGTAIAGAPGNGERRNVDLRYAIYFGGFDILKLDVRLALEGTGYDLGAAVETGGVADLMFTWSLRANASGRLDGARVRPVWAYLESLSRGKKRWTTLRFDEQGPSVASSEPEHERPDIPPEKLRDALDVASAFLQLSRSIQSGQECDTRIAVFDGKRGFDFAVTRLMEDKLPRSRYSAFSGAALLCTIALEAVHGKPRKRDHDGSGSQERKASIWIAPIFEGRAAHAGAAGTQHGLGPDDRPSGGRQP